MKYFVRIYFCMLMLVPLACCKTAEPVLENEHVRFAFNAENGALISLYGVSEGVEHIDSAAAAAQPIWAFDYMPGHSAPDCLPTEVSFRKNGKNCLEILWSQKDGVPGPEVKVTVKFKKDRPSLADWRIEANGIEGLGIKSVRFPIINNIMPHNEKDDLVLATWSGTMIHNPWSYATETEPLKILRSTASQALQLNALYNPETEGIFWGTEDPDAWYKEYCFNAVPSAAEFYISHFLCIDVDIDSYSPTYPTVVGVFKGDWITAAELYKTWALKQHWCKDSRLKRGLVPDWVQNTALWVWNRGRSGNVLPEAVCMKNELGLPVSVLWHWWHNCSYDDGFPEYLPPREGRKPFMDAVAAAKAEGVHCLNYMNSYQWGDSTESWKERRADLWCARGADGKTLSKVFNIFSGKSLTPMCLGNTFWQDTYIPLCDTLVNSYGTSGVYLDQACMTKPCYNPDHGHPVGGGNSWVKGHLKMIDGIWEAISSDKEGDAPTLAGEGACEYWMGHLDLGLTLEAANYRLWPGKYEKVPLFQSVYHDYQITYGNVSMLVSPPYDEKWPEEFRPADAETLLSDDFDRQFMMEQAKTFVWGIQPCIANFHEYLFEKKPDAMAFLFDMVKTRYKALDFLLYGEFQRCPQIPEYQEEIPICTQTIYLKSGSRVSRTSRTVATLHSGAWKASDGRLGIAVANIADIERKVTFTLDPALYGLPAEGEVTLITAENDPVLLQSYKGITPVELTVPERSTLVLSIR